MAKHGRFNLKMAPYMYFWKRKLRTDQHLRPTTFNCHCHRLIIQLRQAKLQGSESSGMLHRTDQ